MVATPFHCSSGSALGLDTSAPSISPAAKSPMRSALTAPPSWTSSICGGGPHRVALDHRAQTVGRGAAADLPVGVRGVGADLGRHHLGVLVLDQGRRGPQRLVAEPAPGAEVPAQRAAGAHLDQLGQVGVLVDADGVGRAHGDAGAALDAAVGVNDTGLQLPEPHFARRLGDAVHLLAQAVALHAPTARARRPAGRSRRGRPGGPRVEGLARAVLSR